MPLILAIEPDPGQSTRLTELVRRRLSADLVQAATTEGALAALAKVGDRVPDLVLVPSLLSPQEDAAIAGALRVIAAAANVRMLTIPLLADPEPPAKPQGVLSRLRGKKPRSAPGGCDPDIFADQIAAYLEEAAAEKKARREELEDSAPGGAGGAGWAGGAGGAGWGSAPAARAQTFKPLVIQPVFIDPAVSSDRYPAEASLVLPEAVTEEENTSSSSSVSEAQDQQETMVAALLQNLILPAPPEPVRTWVRTEPTAHQTPIVSKPEPEFEPQSAPESAFEPDPASVLHQQVAERPSLFNTGDADLVVLLDEPISEQPGVLWRQTIEPTFEEPAAIVEEFAATTEAPSPAVETFAALPEESPALADSVDSVEESAPVNEVAGTLTASTFVSESYFDSLNEAMLEETRQHDELNEIVSVVVEATESPASADVVVDDPASHDIASHDTALGLDSIPAVAEAFESAAAARESDSEAAPADISMSPAVVPEPIVEAARALAAAETLAAPEPLATVKEEDPDAVKASFWGSRIRLPKLVSRLVPKAQGADADTSTLRRMIPIDAVPREPERVPEPAPVAETASEQVAAIAAALQVEAEPAIELVDTAPAASQVDAPPLEEPRLIRSRVRKPKATRRRKPTQKPKAREDIEEIDVDALIAPLLSEIAERRAPAPPAPPASPRALEAVAPVETVAPSEAVALSAPEPVARSEYIARSEFVEVPEPVALSAPSDVPDDVDPMFFADDALTVPPPTPAQAERSAWLELVDSLRQDIERLKAERTQPAPAVASAAPEPIVQAVVPTAPAVSEKPAKPPMAQVAARQRPKPRRPIEDQWGLFDPEQCGFAALLAKLDEIGARDDVSA
jgi:hypothetical protein